MFLFYYFVHLLLHWELVASSSHTKDNMQWSCIFPSDCGSHLLKLEMYWGFSVTVHSFSVFVWGERRKVLLVHDFMVVKLQWLKPCCFPPCREETWWLLEERVPGLAVAWLILEMLVHGLDKTGTVCSSLVLKKFLEMISELQVHYHAFVELHMCFTFFCIKFLKKGKKKKWGVEMVRM